MFNARWAQNNKGSLWGKSKSELLENIVRSNWIYSLVDKIATNKLDATRNTKKKWNTNENNRRKNTSISTTKLQFCVTLLNVVEFVRTVDLGRGAHGLWHCSVVAILLPSGTAKLVTRIHNVRATSIWLLSSKDIEMIFCCLAKTLNGKREYNNVNSFLDSFTWTWMCFNIICVLYVYVSCSISF